MARMLEKGIVCLSYYKYPGDDWPVTEFTPRTVNLVSAIISTDFTREITH